MCNKCCFKGVEVPVSELRQQLEYARTINQDIYNVFSRRTPNITDILREYQNVQTKLSMMMDFLFQAKLWCDTLLSDEDENENYNIKEEE